MPGAAFELGNWEGTWRVTVRHWVSGWNRIFVASVWAFLGARRCRESGLGKRIVHYRRKGILLNMAKPAFLLPASQISKTIAKRVSLRSSHSTKTDIRALSFWLLYQPTPQAHKKKGPKKKEIEYALSICPTPHIRCLVFNSYIPSAFCSLSFSRKPGCHLCNTLFRNFCPDFGGGIINQILAVRPSCFRSIHARSWRVS